MRPELSSRMSFYGVCEQRRLRENCTGSGETLSFLLDKVSKSDELGLI